MSAAITRSKIAGQPSRSQPCSVMSGQTPVAMSWSTARNWSTVTPLRSMIVIDRSASPWVCETSGERLRVQLMKTARRSEKSQREVAQSSSCLGVREVMRRWSRDRPGVTAVTDRPSRDSRPCPPSTLSSSSSPSPSRRRSCSASPPACGSPPSCSRSWPASSSARPARLGRDRRDDRGHGHARPRLPALPRRPRGRLRAAPRPRAAPDPAAATRCRRDRRRRRRSRSRRAGWWRRRCWSRSRSARRRSAC